MKDLSIPELIVVIIVLLSLIVAIVTMIVKRRMKGFRLKEVTLKTPMVEATLEPVENLEPAAEKEKAKAKPKRKLRQTPRENKSVSIKGSADGAVIITGDNNEVNK